MSARDRFGHETTAQRRAFRLLTIAQLVQLEAWGLGIGQPPSARKAAMTALGLTATAGRIETGELIDRLRAAARDSIGMADTHGRAPTKPYTPKGDDLEATT